MDYRTHQRRLLPALATTYALSFAQQRLVDELHEVFTDEDADDRQRRELETLAAGVKAVATWHATRDDPELPRGLRRRGLPAREPLRGAEGRHRRLHHLRGRQHRPAAARRQEPADRLQGRVRRARPARAWRSSSPARRSGVLAERTPLRKLDAPRARRRRRPARAQDAARPVPLAPRAPAGGRRAAAEARDRRRARPVRGARRLPGPRARGRALVGRPRRARVVRRGRRRRRAARQAVQPLRAAHASRPSAATTRSTAG